MKRDIIGAGFTGLSLWQTFNRFTHGTEEQITRWSWDRK